MRGTQLGLTVPRLEGDLSGVRRPDKALVPPKPFSILPESLLKEENWIDIDWGRWKIQDHITLGEGRAVIRLLDILTRNQGFFVFVKRLLVWKTSDLFLVACPRDVPHLRL